MNWEKLMKIDSRILYVVVVIVILVPLVKPMGLPLVITKEVQTAFDFIEKLPANSLVEIAADFDPSAAPELLPQMTAMAKHLMMKGHKIVVTTNAAGGVVYLDMLAKELAPQYKYVYGKDIVALPFKAGGESAIAAQGRDFNALYTQDYYGTPTKNLELMGRIKSVADLNLILSYTSGDHAIWYIRYVGQTAKVPIINGTVASSGAFMAPYYASGQMAGFVVGMSGGAEYETLAKVPGKALPAMDAQSAGHVMIVFFVILGNIGYLMSKKRKTA